MSNAMQARSAPANVLAERPGSASRRGSSSPGGGGRARSPATSPTDAPGNHIRASSNSTTAKRGPIKSIRKETTTMTGKDGKDTKTRTSSTTPLESAIDPLSHHIFVRTNTDRSIPPKLRTSGKPDSAANEALPRHSSDLPARAAAPQPEPVKDKKKSASFLSRLSMIGTKKKDGDLNDDDSEISDLRTEGANAVAFTSAVGGGGYIPHHKEPPRYIRVRTHGKKVKEFDRMFLAQELAGTQPPRDDSDSHASVNAAPVKPLRGFGHQTLNTGGPIWAVEFSKDGKYLATAGRDSVVRIWAVISTPEERAAHEEEESAGAGGGNGERLSAPVFRTRPLRELTGHAGEILDLSWSKNNFLLSSSMDKTVRLWHVSRQECLCAFKHKDFVTSIAFHPRDDRFFLAGSLDSVLRLWSIPDKSVAYSSQIADLITAVAFSPDGKTCMAGCLNGLCAFYETEGLKFETQIHVRSSRGKNAKGSKITGIQTMAFPPDAPDGGAVRVLVTSNDSRIRIYNLQTKTLELKFKGHENACNQIRASFSDDGNYVICGSEDKKAFIWSTGPSQSDNKDKRPCEYFEAHSAIVTQAAFAPTATRQLLQASQDPIFTLCNPPPITLLSREEASMSRTTLDQDGQAEQPTPRAKKPEETPAFLERARHHDGNIIITTDHAGIIKVFRQDCAYVKRRHDNWETGSTFSRKLGRDALLGRTGSVMTRTSASSKDPHSRRGSISQAHPGSAIGTLQLNSERIMSWRQGVEGTPTSRPNSIAIMTPARSERSVSPAKARTPVSANMPNLASEARRKQYAKSLVSPSFHPTSPTSSTNMHDIDRRRPQDRASLPPTPNFTLKAVDDDEEELAEEKKDGGRQLHLDTAGASYSFWNLNRWRGIGSTRRGSSTGQSRTEKGHSRALSETVAITTPNPEAADKGRRKSLGAAHATSSHPPVETIPGGRRSSAPANEDDGDHLAPPGAHLPDDRRDSTLSALTSEASASAVSDGGEDMQCSKCGGREFKAKKISGQQRFLCSECGRMVD